MTFIISSFFCGFKVCRLPQKSQFSWNAVDTTLSPAVSKFSLVLRGKPTKYNIAAEPIAIFAPD